QRTLRPVPSTVTSRHLSHPAYRNLMSRQAVQETPRREAFTPRSGSTVHGSRRPEGDGPLGPGPPKRAIARLRAVADLTVKTSFGAGGLATLGRAATNPPCGRVSAVSGDGANRPRKANFRGAGQAGKSLMGQNRASRPGIWARRVWKRSFPEWI